VPFGDQRAMQVTPKMPRYIVGGFLAEVGKKAEMVWGNA